MTGPRPEIAGAMTRHWMRQNGLDPDDPAHVAQHERDLDLARGRRAVEELARRGVELGTPDEEELVDLGRAYRPVELAQILDRIVEQNALTRHDWSAWAERHRGHHHAANESCPHDLDPGQGDQGDPDQLQDQDQTPRLDGARDALSNTPEADGSGNSDNSDQGQVVSHVREQSQSHVRNGKIDRPWTRDQDDESWSPM